MHTGCERRLCGGGGGLSRVQTERLTRCCDVCVRCADAVSLDHVSTNELPRRSLPQLAARRHRHADHVRYDHGRSRRQYVMGGLCSARLLYDLSTGFEETVQSLRTQAHSHDLSK